MWQGLMLCGFLTVAGYGLKSIPVLHETGFSPLVFALLLGLIAGNLPGFERMAPAVHRAYVSRHAGCCEAASCCSASR